MQAIAVSETPKDSANRVLSVALIEGAGGRALASVAIMLIAAAKSRLVILHYMEAHRAARHWRFLYETLPRRSSSGI